MEIRLPKNTEDLRIKHLKALNGIEEEPPRNLNDLIDFVCEFTGEKRSLVEAFTTKGEILKIYEHLLGLFNEFKVMSKPPQTITLKGKEFELINPEKVGIGWHIDFEKSDIKKDPVRVACLFYYPKGEIYGAKDENKNLINPIKDRYNLFENEMQLTTFLECTSFFLRKSTKSMSASIHQQIASRKTQDLITKFQSYLNGKKSSTE